MEQLADGLRDQIADLRLVVERWDADYQSLQIQLNRAQKNRVVNFSFGLGIGATAVYGITDIIWNQGRHGGYYSIGIAGIGTGIYILGHHFNWW